MKYVLLGFISAYDGSYILGVFDSLELAQQGRSDYRKAYLAQHGSESYEYYEIHEREANRFYFGSEEMAQPVDTFAPSKSKYKR